VGTGKCLRERLPTSLRDRVIQLLKEEDRKDILNTLNAFIRDAIARSAYASF
jgi:Mg/Co/Ni transporter MgtE